ncbi:uncharacterized protein LOC134965052 [Pseudophryne corroboree]|uniref:uncharacterized protein LOC134965052 n=1 Tax=Pseudophryne corroboree TaxID=495146 RepID=UPI0030812AE5
MNINEFLVDVSPCISTEESFAAPEVQEDSGESAAVVESALDEGCLYGDTPGLEGLALRSLAPSTLRGYRNAMGEWERYVHLHQEQDLRLDECPIWIMGHSYVYYCERSGVVCLQSPEANLVRWIGVRGLRWEQVIPLFWQQLERSGYPLRVVFHVAGNDLTRRSGLDLRKTIVRDLVSLQNRLCFLSVGWSDIIPRLVWRGADRPAAIELIRRRINSVVGRAVSENWGFVVPHPSISVSAPHLYMADGVHLNLRGMEVFMEDLLLAVFTQEFY